MATENQPANPIHDGEGGNANFQQPPYPEQFQNAVKAALSDCYRLIRVGVDVQAAEGLDLDFIDNFRKEVLRLFYGIGNAEIADREQADRLFWKPLEAFKKRFFKENKINRSHPVAQQILSLFDEARACLLERRDYISQTIAPKDPSDDLPSGIQQEGLAEPIADDTETLSHPLEFIRERDKLVKRWSNFLDFISPFLATADSKPEAGILVGEINDLISSNLPLITEATSENLQENHHLLYDSTLDCLEAMADEGEDFEILSILVRLIGHLMSSLPVSDERLKERLKNIASSYLRTYQAHPDFARLTLSNGNENGSTSEIVEQAKALKEAKKKEKAERRALQSASVREGKIIPETKRSSQYHIQIAQDPDAEEVLKEQFKAISVFPSASRRETFNQVRFYVLFELSSAMVDFIVHLDYKKTPKGLAGKLSEIRNQSGVIDLARVYRAFVSELNVLGKMLRRNELSVMAMATFDELQRCNQLEQAFVHMMSAVFGLDVKHTKRWMDQIHQDKIIDFNSRLSFNRFTGSRYSRSTEELDFDHVKEAAQDIVHALQGSEPKKKELKSVADDFQEGVSPKASAAIRKPKSFPDEDLEFIERELLALLRSSPLYNAKRAEEWVLKLTNGLNDVHYQGQPKYSVTVVGPLVMRLITNLKEGKRLFPHVENRQPIAEAEPKPLGDYLDSFSELEQREIKDNQGWMERVMLMHSQDERLHFEKRLIQALFETAYSPEKIQLLHPNQIRFLTTVITQLRKQTDEFSEMKRSGKLYWSIKELDSAALGGIAETLLRKYRGTDSRFPIVSQANELMLRQQELIESCEKSLALINDRFKAHQEQRDERAKVEAKISHLQESLAAVKSEQFNALNPKRGSEPSKEPTHSPEDFDRLVKVFEAEISLEKERLAGLGVDGEAHRELLEVKKKLEDQRDQAEMRLIQMNLEFGELMEKYSDSKA